MNRNLILIALSLFTWGAGEGLFLYFQPLYLQQLGADPIMIGAIFGGMGIAMAVAQIPAGYLSDRFGSRPIMWASWILGAAATWLMALAGSLPAFIAGLLVYGLTGFVVAPMNSYISSMRGKLSVARALTFVSGMYNLGAVIGPTVGGLLGEKLGLRAVYQIAGVVFILSTAIVFFVQAAPKPEAEEHHRRFSLARNPLFLSVLGVILVAYLAMYLPQPLTPNYLQNQHGLDTQQIGYMGTAASLGNAFATLALGSLAPSVGLIVSQAWMILFCALLWQGTGPIWFAVGYFFVGGYKLSRSMALALVSPLVKPSEMGLAFGMVETMNGIAIVISPVIAGILYDNLPSSIYPISLVAILVTLVINIFLLPVLRRRHEASLVPPEPSAE